MIISFSVFRDKIENGEKCQTIRKYSPGQYQRFLNCWKKRETTGRYNLFWHNPRNGGTRIKDVVPSDKPALMHFEKHHGVVGFGADSESDDSIIYPERECSNDLAIRDGFNGHDEMVSWFLKEYGEELYQSKFIVIRWVTE